MSETISASTFEQMLAGFKPDPRVSRPLAIQQALFIARRLQERAAEDGFTARDLVNELCMYSHACPLADDATLVMVRRDSSQ